MSKTLNPWSWNVAGILDGFREAWRKFIFKDNNWCNCVNKCEENWCTSISSFNENQPQIMHFNLIIHHIVILFFVCAYLRIVCGCSECDSKILRGGRVEPCLGFCIFLWGLNLRRARMSASAMQIYSPDILEIASSTSPKNWICLFSQPFALWGNIFCILSRMPVFMLEESIYCWRVCDEDKLYFIHVPETVKAEQQKVASLLWRRFCETKVCAFCIFFRGSMTNMLKSIFCDLLQWPIP